ncbi:MAG: transcription antitermination factor NusB [Clostridia bacterium]|nr:transcription antitermination factor NusB [Clostridia bacterium]
MPAITRKEAREQALFLLFETEYHADKAPESIYALAVEDRDFAEDEYIRDVYFGVLAKKEGIDERISRLSHGWSIGRIAPVTRNILRLAIYEMSERNDIPDRVAINEAIELVKKYDDEKARAFVNGILNGAKDELTAERASK